MTEIPSQIKIDNWAFHVLARSDDPALRCLHTKNLITNLKTTMQIGEMPDFDILLNKAGLLANQAWYQYAAEKNPGRATQTANAALEMVLFLVYDKRFATPDSDSFKGRGK